MKKLLDWLDHRTGARKLAHEALYENVPGGARWRYVWGSALTFALTVQFLTGIVLWMAYSPSAQTAWESVFYIQNEMWGGWFLRGLHHYTAQAMNVLLVLHLMQVVIDCC
jgi:ubiquinol-cytochrome c reductase cytochrome b subunit